MKIIIWNIAGLPSWFNLHGDPEARIAKIIIKLKSLNADIILLQEVFTKSLIKQVKNAFKKNYYIKSSNIIKNYSLVGSGLISLFLKSKFRGEKIISNFKHYGNGTGEDILANKGYQVVTISSLKLKIINTHLNNPTAIFSRKNSAKEATKKQLEIVRKVFNKCKSPCILGGDLNTKSVKMGDQVKHKIDYICVKGLAIKKGSKFVLHTKLSDHAILGCILI